MDKENEMRYRVCTVYSFIHLLSVTLVTDDMLYYLSVKLSFTLLVTRTSFVHP